MTPRSPLLVGLALVALGLVAFVAAIFVGSSGLDAGRVWAALVGDGSVAETAIVRQIRMPRALLA
ncbi:MAG TPA: iron ABC transporter permease, partial [Rhodothermales bacterium]|nr:iron ABC transporter permease [Rhodothermales bacterium]